MTRARGLALVLAVLLPGPVAACSPPAGEPAAPPVRLEAFLSQPRPDEGTRILRTAIINAGDREVEVTSATVDWSGFERRETRTGDGALEPGGTLGLVLEFGAARCDEPVEDRPRLAAVVDGVERTVPLTVRDPELLDRLRARECGLRALDEAASVDLVLEPRIVVRDGQRVVPGTLEVVRRDGATADVRVVDLGGSVLLRFGSDAPLPAQVGPGRLALPVTVASAGRCDAHALSQSSQTFLIGAYVAVDGAEPVRVLTVPDGADRRRIQTVIRRDCRAGQGGDAD